MSEEQKDDGLISVFVDDKEVGERVGGQQIAEFVMNAGYRPHRIGNARSRSQYGRADPERRRHSEDYVFP